MEVIRNECISKLEIVRILQKAYAEGRIQAKDGLVSVLDDINAADVQPVDRWISVDEALPPDNKAYVVMTKNNGLGVSRLMGRNRIEWTLFGEPVLYWLPIPEPPETTKG